MGKRFKKGFTLIELLIVIAIIAILATVIITNVGNARSKTNNAKVLSEMSEATKAALACVAEEKNVLSVAGGNICSDVTLVPGTWPSAYSSRAYPGGTWGTPVITLTNNTLSSATVSALVGTSQAIGDIRVNCTTAGCVKQTATSTTAWGLATNW